MIFLRRMVRPVRDSASASAWSVGSSIRENVSCKSIFPIWSGGTLRSRVSMATKSAGVAPSFFPAVTKTLVERP